MTVYVSILASAVRLPSLDRLVPPFFTLKSRTEITESSALYNYYRRAIYLYGVVLSDFLEHETVASRSKSGYKARLLL